MGNMNSVGNKPYFLHLAKNGGTSIYLHNPEIEFVGHEKIDDCPSDKKIFCFWRCPKERLISSYEYAKMPVSYWHNNNNPALAKCGSHPDYDLCNRRSFKIIVLLACLQQIPFVYRVLRRAGMALDHPGFWPATKFACSRSRQVDWILNLDELPDHLRILNAELGADIKYSIGRENSSPSSSSPRKIEGVISYLHFWAFRWDYLIYKQSQQGVLKCVEGHFVAHTFN